MHRNMTFGTAKAVLFTDVSSLQGVLIRGVPLYMYIYMYIHEKQVIHPTRFSEKKLRAALGVIRTHAMYTV